MRWLAGRLNELAGTVFAAVTGIAFAQGVAFANAYLQRLGGHIDEARGTLTNLSAGEYGRAVSDPASRDRLGDLVQARIAELEAARSTIDGASEFLKPVLCLFHIDLEIAGGAFGDFVPAIPLDPAGIVYGLLGMVVGWSIWRGAVRVAGRRRKTQPV